MRWIRLNRRIGAWAALFALAVQITLSFGHVHLDNIALTSRLPGHATELQVASRHAPSGPLQHTGAQDFCAICATMAMVASSVLPDVAPLLPPLATPHAWTREFAAALPWHQAHNQFQARAPPFIG